MFAWARAFYRCLHGAGLSSCDELNTTVVGEALSINVYHNVKCERRPQHNPNMWTTNKKVIFENQNELSRNINI